MKLFIQPKLDILKDVALPMGCLKYSAFFVVAIF